MAQDRWKWPFQAQGLSCLYNMDACHCVTNCNYLWFRKIPSAKQGELAYEMHLYYFLTPLLSTAPIDWYQHSSSSTSSLGQTEPECEWFWSWQGLSKDIGQIVISGREWQGFAKPPGIVEGYARVGVWVWISWPPTNPYLQQGYQRYQGYQRGWDVFPGPVNCEVTWTNFSRFTEVQGVATCHTGLCIT